MQTLQFDELKISKEILSAIKDLGFEKASPIQSQAIPLLLEGHDLIGQSQTGTGKTVAFAVPCIEKIDPANKKLQALIMCPTRELSLQVSQEFQKLLKYKKGINIAAIYGGESISFQISQLKRGVQIIIGTPGRIMDHLDRGTIKLGDIETLILDEADRMLDMGFRDDIEFILSHTKAERQTILFSATLPVIIKNLAKKYQKNPKTITIEKHELTTPKIDQTYIEVRASEKMDAITRLIEINDFKLAIIFCNTKRQVDELVSNLQLRGYVTEGFHGDMKQNVRDRVMKKFKNADTGILVATDVAGRGIDIENIDVVINYDLPQDIEDYVHRIGRTGRAGRSGKAISFVSGRELYKLRHIERFANSVLKREKLPSPAEVEKARIHKISEKIKKEIEKGHLDKYKKILHTLSEEKLEIEDIASVLLKHFIEKDAVKAPNSSNSDGAKSNSNPSMQTLFINVGKSRGISPKDIVGAIAGECKLSGRDIGEIKITESYSLVDVPLELAETVIKTMNKSTIRRYPVMVKIDQR